MWKCDKCGAYRPQDCTCRRETTSEKPNNAGDNVAAEAIEGQAPRGEEQMAAVQLVFAAALLREAGEHYSNHGCNDLEWWPYVPEVLREAFAADVNEFQGMADFMRPDEPYTHDYAMMEFFASALEKLAEKRGESPSSGVAVPVNEWTDDAPIPAFTGLKTQTESPPPTTVSVEELEKLINSTGCADGYEEGYMILKQGLQTLIQRAITYEANHIR